MPVIEAYCPMCVSWCGVLCHVDDGKLVAIKADPAHPNSGCCDKGAYAPQLVYHPERVRHPLKRTGKKGEDPRWERISWDEALDLTAQNLLRLKEKYGAESVVFNRPAMAGSPGSDYAMWLRRLSHAFGSPNFLGSTQICNWHKDSCSRYTYGMGIPFPDFENTRLVLFWGFNPQTSWPNYAKAASWARKQGAKLIVIDPRKTQLAADADLWLQVRPGTDGALALSMISVLIEEGLYDREFVTQWTNGPFLVYRTPAGVDRLLTGEDLGEAGKYVAWDEQAHRPRSFDPRKDTFSSLGWSPALEGRYPVRLKSGSEVLCTTAFQLLKDLALECSPERAKKITWVPAEIIRQAARMLGTGGPVCYYSYVGLEEHTNAVQTNRAVCTLYALTGNLDRKGGSVAFPSVPANEIFGKDLLSPEVEKRRLGSTEYPLGPPSSWGFAAYCATKESYQAILEGIPYPVKGLVSFGGNPLISNADCLKGKEALARLDFYVHADPFSNPGAELYADLLLPAATCWESPALKIGFRLAGPAATHVQFRPPVVQPLYESRSDMEIIFQLAVRLGVGDHFWDGDIEEAFEYQLKPSGLTLAQLRANPRGITVNIPVRYEKHVQKDQEGRLKGFGTPTHRVEIWSKTFADHGYDPLPVYREPAFSPTERPDLAERFPLILTMSKLGQFCHSQHRQIPGLRQQVPHPFVEIHPRTAEELGIRDGEWVEVESAHGKVRLLACYTPGLDPRVVCVQHGWWQSCSELGLPGYDAFSPEGANVSLLVGEEATDPISGSVPFRSNLCRVNKVPAECQPSYGAVQAVDLKAGMAYGRAK